MQVICLCIKMKRNELSILTVKKRSRNYSNCFEILYFDNYYKTEVVIKALA
jgi:hypothetical protein